MSCDIWCKSDGVVCHCFSSFKRADLCYFFCLSSCSEVSILLLFVESTCSTCTLQYLLGLGSACGHFSLHFEYNCVISKCVQFSDQTTPAVTNEFAVAAFR